MVIIKKTQLIEVGDFVINLGEVSKIEVSEKVVKMDLKKGKLSIIQDSRAPIWDVIFKYGASVLIEI